MNHKRKRVYKGKELDLAEPASNALFAELDVVRCVLFTTSG